MKTRLIIEIEHDTNEEARDSFNSLLRTFAEKMIKELSIEIIGLSKVTVDNPKDSIALKWCIEDVIGQAEKILATVKRQHDCSIGVIPLYVY